MTSLSHQFWEAALIAPVGAGCCWLHAAHATTTRDVANPVTYTTKDVGTIGAGADVSRDAIVLYPSGASSMGI
jgi:hypothetical protein